MPDAIVVDNLGKYYTRYPTDKPVTIMEAALAGFRGMKVVEKFWALQNINFTVTPGEMLGVIGHNGAGKSTLLQLLGGVTHPDQGKIQINGKIGALLDLGAGFSTDLTGRENVYISAIVAGLTRREVTRRFEAIVEFAELEAFIDNPVRNYSTGMQMRLAFSVAVHTDPEVLLVDEHLSVGDVAFQAKCLDRIGQLKASGCAIVLVSHSATQVQQLCDRALWLRQGEMVAYGEPEVVVGEYTSQMRSETQKRTVTRPPQLTQSGIELRANENRFGSLEVEITDVQFFPTAEISSGDPLGVEIEYWAETAIVSPIFQVSLSCEEGKICFDINTQKMGLSLPTITGKGKIKLEISRLDLTGGQYFVNIGVYEKSWAYAYDYHWHVYPLLIEGEMSGAGLLNPPCRWQFEKLPIASS